MSLPNFIPPESTGIRRNDRNPAGICRASLRPRLLVAFYYGNITYPSHDPPKMGFLLTDPQDAVRGPILLVQPGYVHPSHPPNDLLIAQQDGKSLNRSRLISCRLMIQPLRKDFHVSSRLTFARSTAFLQTSKLRPGQTVKGSSYP